MEKRTTLDMKNTGHMRREHLLTDLDMRPEQHGTLNTTNENGITLDMKKEQKNNTEEEKKNHH